MFKVYENFGTSKIAFFSSSGNERVNICNFYFSCLSFFTLIFGHLQSSLPNLSKSFLSIYQFQGKDIQNISINSSLKLVASCCSAYRYYGQTQNIVSAQLQIVFGVSKVSESMLLDI